MRRRIGGVTPGWISGAGWFRGKCAAQSADWISPRTPSTLPNPALVHGQHPPRRNGRESGSFRAAEVPALTIERVV